MSDDPITQNSDGDIRYIYTGLGQNYQASYIWPSNYELAVRYSSMNPEGVIDVLEPTVQQYTLGVTKYLKGHRLKVQTDITWEQRAFEVGGIPANNWMWRFQVELGI